MCKTYGLWSTILILLLLRTVQTVYILYQLPINDIASLHPCDSKGNNDNNNNNNYNNNNKINTT